MPFREYPYMKWRQRSIWDKCEKMVSIQYNPYPFFFLFSCSHTHKTLACVIKKMDSSLKSIPELNWSYRNSYYMGDRMFNSGPCSCSAVFEYHHMLYPVILVK